MVINPLLVKRLNDLERAIAEEEKIHHSKAWANLRSEMAKFDVCVRDQRALLEEIYELSTEDHLDDAQMITAKRSLNKYSSQQLSSLKILQEECQRRFWYSALCLKLGMQGKALLNDPYSLAMSVKRTISRAEKADKKINSIKELEDDARASLFHKHDMLQIEKENRLASRTMSIKFGPTRDQALKSKLWEECNQWFKWLKSTI